MNKIDTSPKALLALADDAQIQHDYSTAETSGWSFYGASIKPRLTHTQDFWVCAWVTPRDTAKEFAILIGVGPTAEEAYQEWERKAMRHPELLYGPTQGPKT